MSKHNVTAGVGQPQGQPQGSGNGDGRQPATPEREANGQFVAGNKGGPGNPFGRTMAARRRAVAEAEREWDEEMERRLFAGYAEQERQQKEQAERSRPSANGANGRSRPTGNGTNGAGGPSANGRNGHHRRPHDDRNGRAAG